jgi:hypothetical protein
MRLALRVIISFMNLAEAQLDNVSNELRDHPTHRNKFLIAKRQLRQAIRAFVELNDEMGDAGIN